MDSEIKSPSIVDERISQLAKSFPTLQNRACLRLRPFDAIEFMRSAVGAGHGENLAIRFVLGVWNPSTDWKKVAREKKIKGNFARFDIFEAMNCWDDMHICAMAQWINRPFFP